MAEQISHDPNFAQMAQAMQAQMVEGGVPAGRRAVRPWVSVHSKMKELETHPLPACAAVRPATWRVPGVKFCHWPETSRSHLCTPCKKLRARVWPTMSSSLHPRTFPSGTLVHVCVCTSQPS